MFVCVKGTVPSYCLPEISLMYSMCMCWITNTTYCNCSIITCHTVRSYLCYDGTLFIVSCCYGIVFMAQKWTASPAFLVFAAASKSYSGLNSDDISSCLHVCTCVCVCVRVGRGQCVLRRLVLSGWLTGRRATLGARPWSMQGVCVWMCVCGGVWLSR